ncbi:MAG TPA: hypothetical protein VGF77_07000 [Allosphingosinicella sp.]|jgi:hypothetical protein
MPHPAASASLAEHECAVSAVADDLTAPRSDNRAHDQQPPDDVAEIFLIRELDEEVDGLIAPDCASDFSDRQRNGMSKAISLPSR